MSLSTRYSLLLSVFLNNLIHARQLSGHFATKTTYKSAFLLKHEHSLNQSVTNDTMNDKSTFDSRNVLQDESLQDLGQNGFDYLTKNSWPKWCKPVQVNALIRHGIRNAGSKEVDRFINVFHRISPQIQQTHKSLYSALEKLHDVVTDTPPKFLLQEGRVEQRLLAKRLLHKFSDLFSEMTDSSDVLFVATSSLRTVESCESFKTAWQQHLNTVHFNPNINEDDKVLRFFDHCNKYIEEVENNKKTSLKEYYRYVKDNFGDIAANITRRMGFDESMSIHSKEVKALYILAAIEKASLGTSEMTAMFDESDLIRVEYAIDMKNYWKKSYGHDINYQQSCPLLVDILEHMENVVHGKRYHQGVFRFAHAETVLPLQALIGLFKDDQILAANNFHVHKERHFKTSRVAPFSGNVIFVLLECDENADKSEGMVWEKYMVQLLINEVPHKIPGCEQELCPYSILLKKFQNILDTCNFHDVCAKENHEEL